MVCINDHLLMMNIKLKYIAISILISGFCLATGNLQGRTQATWGVIAGISKYQNLPSLRFADRDALAFYEFLLSPAGGSADTNKIRLLLNEKATSYNFFEAMDRLLDEAGEGDIVYIYFAGHGDIEKKTGRQNGFLIGYSSPPACYAAGGCIGVRYLQDYVETLVAKNKAKVVLVVDACRSGKLAGGAEGAELTALALKAEWKGVTKILSCQPGETSQEGEAWGGGAGVFTYYLIRGLKGLADSDMDGIVTLRELSNYLDDNVPKQTNNRQMPEIAGDKRVEIATVDKPTYLSLMNDAGLIKSGVKDITSAGFEANTASLNDINLLKQYEKFKFYISSNKLIAYTDKDAPEETAYSIYRSLESSRANLALAGSMKGELLAALQNKAQSSINKWLSSIDEEYDKIIDSTYMELRAALMIADSSYFQYGQIRFRYLFWSHLVEKDAKIKMSLLDECTRINPNDPLVNLSLGYVYGERKKYPEALKYYNRTVDYAPNWAWAWSNKGMVMSCLGKNDEALRCLDKAISIKHDYALAWYNKANVFVNTGKYEEALRCYDTVFKINSNFNDYRATWCNKGIALDNMGRYEEALRCYDESLKLNPNYIKALYNKGITLAKMKRFDDAIILNDKVLELDPANADALTNKGMALGNSGRQEEAIQCYDKALKIKPGLIVTWYNKGNACYFSGKNDEALECYEQVISLDKNDFSGWYGKGATLSDLGQYPEAIKCLDAAIKLKPDLADAWHIKGNTLYFMKKFGDAVKCYDKVTRLEPEFAEAWYNKACSHSQLKNKSKMLESLKKAFALSPKFKDDSLKDNDLSEYWTDPDFLELIK